MILIAVWPGIVEARELPFCKAYSGIPSGKPSSGLIWIEGGSFTMGSNHQRPEERIEHAVTLQGFWIDQHEVTNAQFSQFVEARSFFKARRAQFQTMK